MYNVNSRANGLNTASMGPGSMGLGSMGPMGPGSLGPGSMGPGSLGPGSMGPGMYGGAQFAPQQSQFGNGMEEAMYGMGRSMKQGGGGDMGVFNRQHSAGGAAYQRQK